MLAYLFFFYKNTITSTSKTSINLSHFLFPARSPWKPHSILNRQSRDAFSGDEITDYCDLGTKAFLRVLVAVDC